MCCVRRGYLQSICRQPAVRHVHCVFDHFVGREHYAHQLCLHRRLPWRSCRMYCLRGGQVQAVHWQRFVQHMHCFVDHIV